MIEAIFVIVIVGAEYAMYTYSKRLNNEINKKLTEQLIIFPKHLIFIVQNINKKEMRKIIRLTESDLHNLVQRSVLRILREQDNNLLLQSIAQGLVQQQLTASQGENEVEVQLQGDAIAQINFVVESDPYMRQGMRSNSYDVPDDEDEIIDKPTVEVGSIEFCDGEGEGCIQIHDNGIVKKALESVINVDYTDFDIPSEQDYYSEY